MDGEPSRMSAGAIHARAPIFGRERELASLTAGLDDARASQGAVYLIGGEPGVGKTRLLEELAIDASLQGVVVAWGRCWEGDDAPPFWPWVQVMRTLVRLDEAAGVIAADAQIAAQLARMVPPPRMQSAAADHPVPSTGEGGAGSDGVERFELFEGVAAFFRALAGRRPLLIQLDDLHAASLPSLLLLRYVARDLRDAAVLIAAAYRDTEAGAGRLVDELGELARESTAVPLRGLDAGAIRALVGARAGADPSDDLIRALQEATGGNPFFLDEVVRLLVAEGRFVEANLHAGPIPVPERVRSAVRGRLAAARIDAGIALRLGAVAGPEFDGALVAAVAGADPTVTIAELEVAAAAGFLRRLEGGAFRFAHAVIRETLYDDLSPAQRVSLHARLGATLLARQCEHAGNVAVLAHHFLQGQPDADASQARRLARGAGDEALDACAYEDAAAWFEKALAVPERDAPRPPSERVELLLALASAAQRAGDGARAAGAVAAAAADARQLGSATLLADAALTLRVEVDGAAADPQRIALLEEALAALGPEDAPRRARVLAQLARELYHAGDVARRLEYSLEAVDMARRLGDPRILAAALGSRCAVLLGLPAQEDERVPLATELLELAGRTGDRELVIEAYRVRVADRLAHADLVGLDREVATATRLAERLRQPHYRWWCAAWRASRAILAGRFADAERLATEAHELGQRVRPHDASSVLSAHLWALLWLRGAFEQIVPMMEAFRAQNEDVYPEIRIALTAAYCGAGRVEDARREFEDLAHSDFDPIPQRSGSWLNCLANLADACATLGDRRRARLLYAHLLPSRGRAVVTPTGLSCFGPVDHYLGVLAATTEDWEAADVHFTEALMFCRRLASPPLAAMVAQGHAAMLLARGRLLDRRRIAALLDEAETTAAQLGMGRITREVDALRARLRDARADPAAAADGERDNRVIREGEQWTFRFRGHTCRVRSRAGLTHLAVLLAHPHEQLSVSMLVGAAADQSPQAAERLRVRVTRALRETIARIRAVDAELGEHLARSVRTGRSCSYAPPQPIRWSVLDGGRS